MSRSRQCPQRCGASRLLRGATALVLAVACGGAAGPLPPSPATNAAPARFASTAGAPSGPVCGGADPHARHLNGGLACAACHPGGGQFGFAEIVTYPRGTSSAGGTVARTPGAPATCTVACHFPMGGSAHTVTWTPGSLDCTACHEVARLPPAHPSVSASAVRSDCEACHAQGGHTGGTVALVGHAASWMDPVDPGFHAFAANRGLAVCQTCHLADLGGGVTGFSCARCHDTTDPAGTAVSWKTNCVLCHGGAGNQTGAPPRATWGNASDAIRTGAHASHVAAGALAPAFDCGVCHVKPADAFSAGHIDGATAAVVFGGVAASGTTPSWDRTTATCSSTYCHGATLGGGTNKLPIWTAVGQGQTACGTCHGVPPPAPHPEVASDLTRCAACHSLTIDAAGVLIPPAAGGKHLDGFVEALGHAASWMDPASPGFHAVSANRGLDACASCHGADLSGGTAGVACARCHDANLPSGIASWKVNCVMCHGGADNLTGAPPKTTWGNSADPVRTGAHGAHVAANAVAAPFACSVCHVMPADALSPGHVDAPLATVTWSGLARAGGAAPLWNRSAATCSSTYCHGNYSGTYAYQVWDYGIDGPITKYAPYAGSNATPSWTGGSATCDSCHGNPPRATGVWHSGHHMGGNDCQLCHPDASGTGGIGTAITNVALHVNGSVDVQPIWKTSCTDCH